MKILMLGWELPPHNSGGLGVACYNMSKAIAQEGSSIDFVVPYEAEHQIDFMNIVHATKLSPLHRYGMGAYDGSHITTADQLDEHGNPITSIREVQKRYTQFVEKWVVDHKPDVIHAHDWLTMEAGMRLKQLTDRPLIVHVHATEFDRAGSKEGGDPIIHEIEYQGLMMADRIIAVSHITKDIIVKRYHIPADKVEVVHNAFDRGSIDHYDYDKRTYRYLEDMKQEGYTVVSAITRFTVQKGLTHLLEAAAKAIEKHDKLLFLLAGDGHQRDELIRLASELGISDKVFFTGFVRGKQWRDAYKVSDIFVMSSISEPFGLTALEAAHYDSALILTKTSGVSEVLSHILRYDFWDIDRLADQIVGISTSPGLRHTLKTNVKHEYARLSWQQVAHKCIDIFNCQLEAKI